MSLSKECTSGVRHEGTPEHDIQVLNGVNTYVAIPKDGLSYSKEKAVLFLTDVFGVQLINNQLLADDFARNGLQVYMPDYFHGDPIPEDAMNSPNFDREAWRARHAPETVRPVIDKLIVALKEKGITSFGAVGYCFGARYVIDLAHENAIQVAVITHPSRLQIPADFDLLIEKSKAPLLINSCEVDQSFDLEAQKAADEHLEGKYAPGYHRTYWPGCRHGFAVRGDMSDPLVKAGKEGVFKATVEWFLNN